MAEKLFESDFFVKLNQLAIARISADSSYNSIWTFHENIQTF